MFLRVNVTCNHIIVAYDTTIRSYGTAVRVLMPLLFLTYSIRLRLRLRLSLSLRLGLGLGLGLGKYLIINVRINL